ncbi:MAG: transcriptional regulator [Micavibrio sp.]|nr:MAG: transcriptional regulator [Micavibrio sp.]
MLKNSTLHNYKAGQLLVQQGDQPTHAYLIIEGRVRTLRTNEDGDEATIRMLGKGEVCMEAVLFMGGPSPVAVQVVEDAQLMLIPEKFVKKFVLQDHQFAANLLKIVTHHYKTAMHQIDAMAIKSPVQRVGYYFLQKHIEQGSDNMEFELPFKKSTIANHLGITPETFSRALGQIKKMGVEVDGEKIRLKEAYALCHFCDPDAAYDCTLSNKEDCPHCPAHAGNCH